MKQDQNPMAPSVAICLFALLLISPAASQTTEVAHQSEMTETQESTGLLLSTSESPAVDGVCPHCNILSEMPMELADKINEINDVDIFVHDFVDETNTLSNVSSLAGHPASRNRRALKDQPRQATCQPVDTVVSTIPADERNPLVFYFPSCVLIKQCGGCCAHSGTSCTPTEEVEKQIPVKKTRYVSGNKLVADGDITVTLKEHKKCRCQCKKTASDCNSLQKFIANQCRCECQNIAEADACGKDPRKLFDPKTCSCQCSNSKDCPTGYDFDQNTCQCQPITDDDDDETQFQFLSEHEEHSETYEASEDTKYDTVPATEGAPSQSQ